MTQTHTPLNQRIEKTGRAYQGLRKGALPVPKSTQQK